MPPKPRRKGPAHQNSFAFKHNPNSKRTAKILAAPIAHVCRRCHDKLEWRKQYRKYKPRTQPGKCNGCQRKNVTAAYHTICESCTRVSPKARALLDEWNTNGAPSTNGKQDTARTADNEDEETKQITASTDEELAKVVNDASSEEKEDDENDAENPTVPTSRRIYHRICAMCVKEPAMASESDPGRQESAFE